MGWAAKVGGVGGVRGLLAEGGWGEVVGGRLGTVAVGSGGDGRRGCRWRGFWAGSGWSKGQCSGGARGSGCCPVQWSTQIDAGDGTGVLMGRKNPSLGFRNACPSPASAGILATNTLPLKNYMKL